MSNERIRPLSRVTVEKFEMDTVAESMKRGGHRAFDLILQAQAFWYNMEKFRKARERNKRYCYGDQWDDMIVVDGKTITEKDYIEEQGSIPLSNNLIRRLVRNVLGVYRSQAKEPTCVARDGDEQRLGETMSTMLQCNWQINRMSEVNARSFEDFLIGGLVAHKKWFGWRNNSLDCWTDYVNPNNLILDANMQDFRGWDLNFIGEIHDIDFNTLCGKFAHSPDDYARLANIYSHARDRRYIREFYDHFGSYKLRNLDFMMPSDLSRCRVIEVWRKEMKPRYRCHDKNTGETFKVDIEDYTALVERVNADRLQRGMAAGMPKEEVPLISSEFFFDDYWYFYYLSPFGDILQEGETPYQHKSHPYVFKAYPFIDSEIHSFVSDVLDQQRYTNRLVTMYDWIMRASAKGALLFPEEAIPDNMTIEDIADEWTRFNGVIAVKTQKLKPGMMPTQVSNNSVNIGITELLNLQLKFFEDISGVQGALQGKPGYSGISGSLYAQQTQNATTSLLDILDTFSGFIRDCAYKDVKNIQQYYDSKRIVNIAGRNRQIEYDPQRVQDVEFDLSIVESSSTPAYRQIANDFLMQIWSQGQITLEQLLEHGSFPFGDELLQSIKGQREQMEAGQTPEELSPQLMQQAEEGADMNAVNAARDMLMGRYRLAA